MEDQQWIMKTSSQIDFCKLFSNIKYSFFKGHQNQMMPEPPQFHRSLCGFYSIHEEFHLFKFPREETAGVHNNNEPSFMCKDKQYFIFFNVKVLVQETFCFHLYSPLKFSKTLQQPFYKTLSDSDIERGIFDGRLLKIYLRGFVLYCAVITLRGGSGRNLKIFLNFSASENESLNPTPYGCTLQNLFRE